MIQSDVIKSGWTLHKKRYRKCLLRKVGILLSSISGLLLLNWSVAFHDSAVI